MFILELKMQAGCCKPAYCCTNYWQHVSNIAPMPQTLNKRRIVSKTEKIVRMIKVMMRIMSMTLMIINGMLICKDKMEDDEDTYTGMVSII